MPNGIGRASHVGSGKEIERFMETSRRQVPHPRATDENAGDGRCGRPLPADLTSFEGRRHELADVKRLLGEGRHVTLTGFGGVGKTRLALRAARDLSRQFRDGVAWVELADLRDSSLLAQSVEDSLCISDRSGPDPLAVVLNHVRDRRLLLVLDNCEHMLEPTAQLVDTLLRSATGIRVLTTSRQGLGVPGEVVLPVAPLPVPDEREAMEPGAANRFPALSLFRERVAAVSPGFEITADNQAVVAELCRKLEGIPLAIELAAVKVRVLSVQELVERLDARLQMLKQHGRTGPSRHQTIQATIDWSYELCTDDEKLLWARASVFAGGFGIDAAEHVCRDERLPQDAVLDAVEGLVDKSVLVRTETDGHLRFRLLEPLREHGQARLREADEEDGVLHRHLEWCEELISQACMQWFGPAQERWCVILKNEHANVRAAAEHCLTHDPCTERALSLLGDPWFLWVALYLDEGRHWLERALAQCPDETSARARALGTAGYVAALQGDRAGAEALLADGRRLAASLEDTGALGYVTHVAGLSALFHDPGRAVDLFLAALPLYDEADVYDDYPSALRIQLGLAFLFQGALTLARQQFDHVRAMCTLTGERWLLSYVAYGEGFLSMAEGDLDEAVRLAGEALTIKRFFGDRLGMAMTLDLIAWVKAGLKDAEEAAVLLGAASGLWDSFGVRLFGSDDWLAQRQLAIDSCTTELGHRAYQAAYATGEQLSQTEALALALGEKATPRTGPEPSAVHLTPREKEIADLVGDGLSNKAIAERLVIAPRTAEGHVENILGKFGFRSRSQIAAWVGERRSATFA